MRRIYLDPIVPSLGVPCDYCWDLEACWSAYVDGMFIPMCHGCLLFLASRDPDYREALENARKIQKNENPNANKD